jgi:esterase/lipase
MKALAESLHQYSYTCYTASYSAHGLAIDDFLNYTSTDWL